jgi:hypothetical protein
MNFRIKIFNLTGKMNFKFFCIEMGDFVGSAYAVDAVLPNSSTLFPKGVTAPSPVMTTLFI